MGPGRYFGNAVWNAEKPSVLLPMRAIPLLVPFILACLRMKMMHSDVMGSEHSASQTRYVEGPTARTREWPTLCASPLARCYYPSSFERPSCEIINLAYLQKLPLRGIIWEVHYYFTDDTYKGAFLDSTHLYVHRWINFIILILYYYFYNINFLKIDNSLTSGEKEER